MPQITLELLRKRVEHNEGEIQTVEELALHQEKLTKLENLDKWCRKLKILLLQNNLISKIENVGRLKELEYLNLALNIVERIENLEGCESLKKLDLTLNFIGEISSVKNLQQNYMLESLYLTGNPCCDYPGYRKYVINLLPELKSLDGQEITTTERILSRQDFLTIEKEIQICEEEYLARRNKEKNDLADQDKHSDVEVIDTDEYWQQVTPNTPEARIELQMHSLKLEEKSKDAKGSMNSKQKEKKAVSLFFADGRPRNINEPKISFSLHDEQDRNLLVLDLAVPKYMDSSLLTADVQPTYAKFEIKGKIFQISLPEEVKPDSSIAQRSKTTGHLVVTMPKLQQTSELIWKGKFASVPYDEELSSNNKKVYIDNAVSESETSIKAKNKQNLSKNEKKLEKRFPDWRNIIPDKDHPNPIDYSSGAAGETLPELKPRNSKDDISFSADILTELIGETNMPILSETDGQRNDFIDDPSVPPLC